MLIALLLVSALGACAFGRKAQDWEVARGPAGVSTDIKAGDVELSAAELLEVQDSALLVRAAGERIAAVHFSAIEEVRMQRVGFWLLRGRMPDAETRARWAAVARFPQGLSPELQARLLAAFGRTEVEHIR
jgi:hypothetical protein